MAACCKNEKDVKYY